MGRVLRRGDEVVGKRVVRPDAAVLVLVGFSPRRQRLETALHAVESRPKFTPSLPDTPLRHFPTPPNRIQSDLYRNSAH